MQDLKKIPVFGILGIWHLLYDGILWNDESNLKIKRRFQMHTQVPGNLYKNGYHRYSNKKKHEFSLILQKQRVWY